MLLFEVQDKEGFKVQREKKFHLHNEATYWYDESIGTHIDTNCEALNAPFNIFIILVVIAANCSFPAPSPRGDENSTLLLTSSFRSSKFAVS